MTSRPIIFSAPMVCAILDGTKTQTRRIVKPQPSIGDSGAWFPVAPRVPAHRSRHYANESHMRRGLAVDFSRYGVPGDRLWVRETWQELRGNGRRIVYRADGEPMTGINGKETVAGMRWRPSIYLRRQDSRITLEITGVRVERLQDISAKDAIAEGIDIPAVEYSVADHPWAVEGERDAYARNAYRNLWDSINAKRAPWVSNPWVWVVEFRRQIISAEVAASYKNRNTVGGISS